MCPALKPQPSPEDCRHRILIESVEQPGVDVYVCARCDAIVDLMEYVIRRAGSAAFVHYDPTGKTREPPHCPTCSCEVDHIKHDGPMPP